ncbi:hypothetical protein J3F84DRAFT_346370 [Trichoderma pleuroticola]
MSCRQLAHTIGQIFAWPLETEDEAEAIAIPNKALDRDIPLPPSTQELDSFMRLYSTPLKSFYRDDGAALVRKSPNSKVIAAWCSRMRNCGALHMEDLEIRVDCPFKLTSQ